MASSGRKLNLRGAQNIVAEVTAQILGGSQIDPPAAYQIGQLCLDSRETQEAGLHPRLEFHQQIYVAVGTCGLPESRPKERQPHDVMAAAKFREP